MELAADYDAMQELDDDGAEEDDDDDDDDEDNNEQNRMARDQFEEELNKIIDTLYESFCMPIKGRRNSKELKELFFVTWCSNIEFPVCVVCKQHNSVSLLQSGTIFL